MEPADQPSAEIEAPPVDGLLRDRLKAKMFPDTATPPKIGRFTVNDEVGAGGMGVVYAGFDPELHRPVAIKLLHGTAQTEQMQSRLRQEARSMAQLSHPNVVQVHEVGEHEGRVFLAMEFVQGRDLQRWLFDKRPGLWQLLEVFLQAGRGLAAAHRRALVHRDFKPTNAMVQYESSLDLEPRVRVMDFGLARSEATAAASPAEALETTIRRDAVQHPITHTREGDLVGTPVYMAPEQLRGKPATAKSDQFAFCVALFEGLFGCRPFFGETLADLTANVLTGRQVEVRRDVVPAWLNAVIDRGLSPEPNDRFENMEALLEAIERGRTEGGLGGTTASRQSPRGRKWLQLAILTAIGGGIGGMGGYLSSGDADSGRLLIATITMLLVMFGMLGYLSRGSLAKFGRPSVSFAFETSVPRERAVDLIVRNSGRGDYTVDDQDWARFELCLHTRPSMWSYGTLVRVRVLEGTPTRVQLDARPVWWAAFNWWWRPPMLATVDWLRQLLGTDQRFPIHRYDGERSQSPNK